MTTLLLKLFVKDYKDTSKAPVRAAYGLLSSVVGIVCNTLLCSFKFVIGSIAGSAAMIADAANNLSDIATCVIGLVGFQLAAKPADEEHPYGHGRYEYILSLIVSFFVMLMGVELLKSAIEKLLHPQPIHYSPFVLAVLIASIAVKLWMGVFNRSLSKKADIPALKAVSTDSFSDCVCTGAVLGSMLINRFFGLNLDAYIGAAVSLPVIWSGIGILKSSLQPLIGRPADKEIAEKIGAFILGFDESILGYHDLMLHDYGMGRVFAVADVEVPADSNLVQIHEVIDRLEKSAEAQFSMQLVLHMDPVDVEDTQLEKLKRKVEMIVKSVDEHYTIHDFCLSDDGKQMFFDLVIDSDIEKDSAQIGEMVALRIRAALGEEPEPVIKVEFPF